MESREVPRKRENCRVQLQVETAAFELAIELVRRHCTNKSGHREFHLQTGRLKDCFLIGQSIVERIDAVQKWGQTMGAEIGCRRWRKKKVHEPGERKERKIWRCKKLREFGKTWSDFWKREILKADKNGLPNERWIQGWITGNRKAKENACELYHERNNNQLFERNSDFRERKKRWRETMSFPPARCGEKFFLLSWSNEAQASL